MMVNHGQYEWLINWLVPVKLKDGSLRVSCLNSKCFCAKGSFSIMKTSFLTLWSAIMIWLIRGRVFLIFALLLYGGNSIGTDIG